MKVIKIIFFCSLWHAAIFPAYDAIKQFLGNYQRPITILELGPAGHAYSFQIVQDFDATCVMISDDVSDALFARCVAELPDRIVLLKRRLTLPEVVKLSECEHFDVVLVLNGLGFIWDEENEFHGHKMLEKIIELGDHCFIAFDARCVNIENHVASFLPGALATVGVVDQKTIILHSKPKKRIWRTQWNKSSRLRYNVYDIASSFTQKTLCKKQFMKTTPWIQGINLVTFKMLNGVYPQKDQIIEGVEVWRGLKHNDIAMCNFVV